MSKITAYKSTKFKTSHELAEKMQQVASFLLSKPDFKAENGAYISSYDGKLGLEFDSKEAFVDAVKIVGDSVKEYSSDELYAKLNVYAMWAPIKLYISRDKVCKKVVTYDCEPLFSEEEVEAL